MEYTCFYALRVASLLTDGGWRTRMGMGIYLYMDKDDEEREGGVVFR